jgi:hypothetical protein
LTVTLVSAPGLRVFLVASSSFFTWATASIVPLNKRALNRVRFISVRSEIILDHLSILHDKPDTLEFGNIGYGVARNRDQTSKFSRLDAFIRAS